MSLANRLLPLAILVSPLAIGGCAAPFHANVARFQALPPPAGQTFTIQPADQRDQGGLEFATYAAQVSQRLQQVGYQPAGGPTGASLVVTLGYGVDHGRERIETTPGIGGFGPYGYGGFGFGGFGYGRFGGWRGRGWYGGWGDPFYDPFGPDIHSYTVFTSHLDMQIRRTADGQSLFEGHAQAHSGTNALPRLVPNLIDAMFTGFPGHSGETIRITLPPEHPQQAAQRG